MLVKQPIKDFILINHFQKIDLHVICYFQVGNLLFTVDNYFNIHDWFCKLTLSILYKIHIKNNQSIKKSRYVYIKKVYMQMAGRGEWDPLKSKVVFGMPFLEFVSAESSSTDSALPGEGGWDVFLLSFNPMLYS